MCFYGNRAAELTHTSQRLLPEYFGYMEKAGLIRLLHTHGKSLRALGKADKVYLDNTNLSYALTDRPNTGSLRETFFANQMEFAGKAELPEGAGDFFLSGNTYEIGDEGKSAKQMRGAQNAYIVRDGITSGHGNVLPMWTFGFLY